MNNPLALRTEQDVVTEAAYAPYVLPLDQPWCCARGSWAARRGWLVRLVTSSGRVGYGDCAPLEESGTESPARVEHLIPRALRACLGHSARWWLVREASHWQTAPALQAAVETALLDIRAQHAGVPLAVYLNPNADGVVAVNASLGPVDSEVEDRVRQALEQGFRILKLKLGIDRIADELARLRRLCAWLPPGVKLRLDANGAWNWSQAHEVLAALKGLPVDCVEEPLAHPTSMALQRLQFQTPWAIALDESLSQNRPLWAGHRFKFPTRRVIIKVPVQGGLLTSLALAEHARADGVECVVTTLVDSAVGRLAALHLAAALDRLAVHGLATGSWLREDTGLAPSAVNGSMTLPAASGLGFVPHDSLVFHAVAG